MQYRFIPFLVGVSSMFFSSCTSKETLFMKAERFCRDMGGIQYVVLPPKYLTTDTSVHCNNGNSSTTFMYFVYPTEE